MGVARGSARLLMREAKQRPFGGRLLQLGRSSVYFTGPELEDWAHLDDFRLAPVDEPELSHDPRLAAAGCLGDRTFFQRLGFDRVESCDIADWEGAEHVFDLNGEVPPELEGRFDAVFETGTIVQIFDLPQVLRNLWKLLAPGGRVIHCAVPSNNHMDLGFYMLCPTFFSDFYSANGWRIDSHLLCEYFAYWHRGRLYSDRWRIYQYRPGMLDPLSYGRYGAAQAATFLVATKIEGATGDVVPQLGQYRQTWEEYAAREPGERSSAGLKEADARARGLVERVDDLAGGGQRSRLPVLLKRLGETVRRRLLKRKMPRPIARL
ncbi:MAG TPA: hypothetical protein VMT85_00230 [Thermoanaerobaculia bacterium]|nr:hypothetical protein [Thermoanaerobaculia bacterium]